MEESYSDRLARVDQEVQAIREQRAEQALRVTAGYTIAELQAMPDSALRRWEAEVERLREEPPPSLWICKTCGALFPHTRGDDDIARCSKCVEVEALVERVKTLLVERNGWERRARELESLCADRL